MLVPSGALRNDFPLILSLLSIISLTLLISTCRAEAEDFYTNVWAVRVLGGLQKAKEVAEKNGFTLGEEVLKDHYTFYHRRVAKRSLRGSVGHHALLSDDPQVLWLEQQVAKRRVKRDSITFNDPRWKSQWYLDRRGEERNLDMNLVPAWRQGFTGKGVVVTILDDGIERDHPDLVRNYDYRASKDINGRDQDPMPRYDYTNENRHGTRCAGEVAASANNSECGVGVAYDASIGGIRMLDGDVTDSVEAMSLSHNKEHIDIYSASWGPDDDGKTVDGPGPLARQAFREGITLGRGGKGSIFVWASGNGGRDKDSCGCDGYTNNIYTLSISSATEYGNVPWYSEACASTLSSTYSSGDAHEQQIVTTDLRKSCTDEHTGTSASAPLAAGIVALVLQANPSLTWRDMQYLVVMSSNPHNLKADDWVVNGVGRRVSHHFGYGIMNAGKMVELAKNWTNVPPQTICEVISPDRNRKIPAKGKLTLPLKVDGCLGTSNQVVYLEHVQAKISLTSSWRGDVVIRLTSPMGTKSTLLSARANDNNNKGFSEWEFMTTHNWGEFAKGEWILEVENGYRASATLKDFALVLHGTQTVPYDSKVLRLSDNSMLGCTGAEVLYRNICVRECPHGWYSRSGVCDPCHVSCASCTSSIESSCTECYHGSFLHDGICLPLGESVKIDAGAVVDDEGLAGLAPNTLWWLMVGATIAVCLLVIFLVLLAIYYAYTQNYLCPTIAKTCTVTQTSSVTASSDATSDRSGGTTPEHIKLTSQNSSQQELMTSSEGEEEVAETRKLRRHLHIIV